jgi:hypothetical protein
VFCKEVRLGSYAPNASSLPPAAIVAAKAMAADPRAEPRYGERVPYVVSMCSFLFGSCVPMGACGTSSFRYACLSAASVGDVMWRKLGLLQQVQAMRCFAPRVRGWIDQISMCCLPSC